MNVRRNLCLVRVNHKTRPAEYSKWLRLDYYICDYKCKVCGFDFHSGKKSSLEYLIFHSEWESRFHRVKSNEIHALPKRGFCCWSWALNWVSPLNTHCLKNVVESEQRDCLNVETEYFNTRFLGSLYLPYMGYSVKPKKSLSRSVLQWNRYKGWASLYVSTANLASLDQVWHCPALDIYSKKSLENYLL